VPIVTWDATDVARRRLSLIDSDKPETSRALAMICQFSIFHSEQELIDQLCVLPFAQDRAPMRRNNQSIEKV
jgi:hypothetical protein